MISFADILFLGLICIMAIPVVEFSREGSKIRKVFWLKINCSQMKLLNFENWSIGELSKIEHHFRKLSDLKIDVINKCQ